MNSLEIMYMWTESEFPWLLIIFHKCMSHGWDEVWFRIIICIISVFCYHISAWDEILEYIYFFWCIEWTFDIRRFHMSFIKRLANYGSKISSSHKYIEFTRWIHKWFCGYDFFLFFLFSILLIAVFSMIASISASTLCILCSKFMSRVRSFSILFW